MRQTVAQTDVLQKEDSGQVDASEAACSGVACEAQDQEIDDDDQQCSVLLPYVAVSTSLSEVVVSHACLLATHSSERSEHS